jgi:hypothetical protein
MNPDLGRNVRDNVSEITVREEVNESLTARSTSKSISDSNKNAVSSTSRASSSKGGYAVGEATSETAGQVEISVTVSPEDETHTNPFSSRSDNDSNFLYSSKVKGKDKLLASNKPLDILSMFRDEVPLSPIDIEEVVKTSINKEEIRPLINKESNINKQLSKIGTNFKSSLDLAKERSYFTKIVGIRLLDEVNTVKIFCQYYNLKGLIIPEKLLINYYHNHP